jgi:hypothetical protein
MLSVFFKTLLETSIQDFTTTVTSGLCQLKTARLHQILPAPFIPSSVESSDTLLLS